MRLPKDQRWSIEWKVSNRVLLKREVTQGLFLALYHQMRALMEEEARVGGFTQCSQELQVFKVGRERSLVASRCFDLASLEQKRMYRKWLQSLQRILEGTQSGKG